VAIIKGVRTVSTKVGGATQKFGQGEIYITDYRNILAALRDMEGEVLKEFFKNAKDIAKPVQAGIKKSIPLRPPIRGMAQASNGIPGRLTWANGKPARSATIVALRPKAKIQGRSIGIVKVVVKSPATIMADMAGKSMAYVGKRKETEPYAYTRTFKGKFGSIRSFRTVRTHKINGQGRAMIDKLGSQASRFVWPGAMSAYKESVTKMSNHLDTVIIKIQREV
jgi:hypothetical protein